MAKTQEQAVKIAAIETQRGTVKIVGDTSLICNRFPPEQIEKIKNKGMRRSGQGKKTRDLEAEFHESYYKNGKNYLFPATGLKKAAVSACRFIDGAKMTEIRGAFHVLGDFITLKGEEPIRREDIVPAGKRSNGSTVAIRSEFKNWSIEIPVRYNVNAISVEQLVNLFNVAGFGVGIGAWRPECNGSFGMFHVAKRGE